jgi:hypothetical protein
MITEAIKLTAILLITIIILPNDVYAYLDPGSGSYLIQILVAAVAGGGLILKSQWQKIRNIFYKEKGKENNKDDEK